MSTALMILLPLALLGVVAALALGLRSFTQEGDDARARSNRLMQWRIGLQVAALALLGLLVLFGSSG